MPKIKGGYYIKARAIQDSEIATKPPHFREIWDWLIKECNHEDRKVGDITIKRGQCLRSYKNIREGLHWMVGWRKMMYSKNACESSMKWLKKHTMITTTKTTRGMIVTILNYNTYQDPKNYEAYKNNTMTHTRSIQTADTINKNKKNLKKKEKEFTAPFLGEVKLYFIKRAKNEFGDSVDNDAVINEAKLYFDIRTNNKWVKANKKKVKNWKNDAGQWILSKRKILISYNGNVKIDNSIKNMG